MICWTKVVRSWDFINPVVFNTLVNQWCIKKCKNVFKLAFRLHVFCKIPEMLETHSHKRFNLRGYHGIKRPSNVVFRVNCKIKMQLKFHTVKIFVLKYIRHVTFKSLNYFKINSINPWYLAEYLTLVSTDEKLWNQELITQTNQLRWKCMKIKFNLDDDLPLNKMLELHNMVIVVRSVSHESNKYYR